jgi:GntR family transcriptional regulator
MIDRMPPADPAPPPAHPRAAGPAGTRRDLAAPAREPLYAQVQALLEHGLERAEWKPGEAIPSELDLAARFGVSQGTVRKAIEALAAANRVVRRQGKGTFVATHTEERSSNFRFLRIRRDDGEYEYPASRLVELKRARAGADAARALELRSGEGVYLLRRVLEYGGRPVILDEITLPAARFRGLTRARYDAFRGSMYGFFEAEFGVHMLRAVERLRAVSADRATAALLRVAAGAPLLAVDRVTYTWGERPVELRRELASTARHHYWNELA